MPDKSLSIWQVAFIESHLTSDHGPTKIAAIPTAFFNGFEVEEIAQCADLPMWRVQQVLLADARNRTNDD